MIEKGKVLGIRDGEATIELAETEHCRSCNICSSLGERKKREMRIEAVEGLEEGQEVTIEIESKAVLKAGFLVFIMPLLMFIVGALIAEKVFGLLGVGIGKDAGAFLLGFLFLIVTFAIVYFADKRARKKRKLEPRIVEIEGIKMSKREQKLDSG